MKTKFLTIIFLLSFCSLVFCVKASAEVKTFTVSAKSFIGDNQTKNDARMLATLEAKRKALEQAGTYLESLTIVENFQLKKDEILAYTAGVAKTEIIEEKPIVEGESFGIEITAKITVDTSILAEKIKKLKENNTLLEQNKELIKRTKELEEELKNVYKKLNTLKNSDEIKQYKKTEVANVEAKYSATEWFENETKNKKYKIPYTDIETYMPQTNPIIVPKLPEVPTYEEYKKKYLSEKKTKLGTLTTKPLKSVDELINEMVSQQKEEQTKIKKQKEKIEFIENASTPIADTIKGLINYSQGIEKSLKEQGILIESYDYNKSINLNPKYAEAYNNRVIAYRHKRHKGLYDKAIRFAVNFLGFLVGVVLLLMLTKGLHMRIRQLPKSK